MVYAYGQTICAVVPCRWDAPAAGRLRFTYTTVARGVLAKTYTLADADRVRELDYTLTADRVTGVESVVGHTYEYDWTLELSDSPWPAGLKFPDAVPRVFYTRAAADAFTGPGG